MAQPGAFRDGMQCPRCGANRLPQYGHSRGEQTWRCGQRHYHFVPGTGPPHQPEQVKAQAARYSFPRAFLLKSIAAIPRREKGCPNQTGNLTR